MLDSLLHTCLVLLVCGRSHSPLHKGIACQDKVSSAPDINNPKQDGPALLLVMPDAHAMSACMLCQPGDCNSAELLLLPAKMRTQFIPPMDILAPYLKVQLGPAQQPSADVVYIYGVGPERHIAALWAVNL